MRLKTKEIKNYTPEELQKKVKELNLELMKLRSQVATGTTPKSPGQIRAIKRNIARIKTLTEAANE